MEESRNTRSYRAFTRQLLHADEHGDMYDGVCFLNTHSAQVEYAEGSFARKELDELHVDLHDGNGASPLDTRQFLRAFEQITRRALQQEAHLHEQQCDRGQRESKEEGGRGDAPFTPAFQVGGAAFQLVSASFTTVCAAARGRSHGLVVEKLPFGVLVVLFREPYSVERVLPRVSRCCAPLRR